jgi:putative ABC transport system permease protein
VIKLKEGANLPQTMGNIETLFSEVEPELPFDYTFLDERIEQLYKSEQRMLSLMSVLSATAIGLAIMGLIGLVSYMVYIRRKEVGIRKVFGASVVQILVLINKEFVLIMLGASVLAVPIIYSAMQLWLSDFAYRIVLSPIVIIGSTMVSLVLVVLIVSLQSAKSANLNPTDVLSEE